jgi:hypothetical protein
VKIKHIRSDLCWFCKLDNLIMFIVYSWIVFIYFIFSCVAQLRIGILFSKRFYNISLKSIWGRRFLRDCWVKKGNIFLMLCGAMDRSLTTMLARWFIWNVVVISWLILRPIVLDKWRKSPQPNSFTQVVS